MRTEVLRIQGLSASRPVGCDLKQIHMNLYEGEVLGLVGLHDSGKSFLFDCLMETQTASEGKIFLYEEVKTVAEWTKSDKIFRIRPQSALVPTQSVMENIFVIRGQRKSKFIVPWKALRQQAAVFMSEFGIEMEPELLVSELSLAECHIVEILKAYISGGTLILIDDIMTPYAAGDYDVLYSVIRRFQEKGISFIVCGCQMEKLQRLTERCLFMVNGSSVKMVDNIRRKQLDEIKVLMGSKTKHSEDEAGIRTRNRSAGEVIFEARDIQMTSGEIINLRIKEGEIVVMVDFFQQWVPQLVGMIAGKQPHSGQLMLEDRPVKKKSRRIYISDFLESNYMINSLSFRDNLCLAVFNKISTFGFLHPQKARVIERIFREQYELSEEQFSFEWGSLSFGEKMAVYLERIKLQKWNIMFCTNIENVMSYELEEMITGQLKDMVRGRRAICICATSFEKYSKLADYYLLLTEEKEIRKFTYSQLCEYFKI
ncbi:MAG: ATP-binding cassette domain-containing protein [Lachnospiraceae bacterium]